MKKIIFVIVLSILALTVIAPKSFKSARKNINESYLVDGVPINATAMEEASKSLDNLKLAESVLKGLFWVVLIVAVVLGFKHVFNKDDDTLVLNNKLTDEQEPVDEATPDGSKGSDAKVAPVAFDKPTEPKESPNPQKPS